MDIHSIGIIGLQELLVNIRNRWILIFAVAFGVLVLAISYFSLITAGAVGFQGFARTSASLLNLVLYIVPLVSLAMGTWSFISEKSAGEMLFSQPVTRTEILLGKVGGLFAAILVRGTSADGTVPLSLLGQYKHVVWYTDEAGASYSGSPSDRSTPITALRRVNSPGRPVILSTYMSQGFKTPGGNVWLCGGGAAFATLVTWNKPNTSPNDYDSREPNPELRPGRMMYDFVHWREGVQMLPAVNARKFGTTTFDYGNFDTVMRRLVDVMPEACFIPRVIIPPPEDGCYFDSTIQFHHDILSIDIPHEFETYPEVIHYFGDLYNQSGIDGLQFHANCFESANPPPNFKNKTYLPAIHRRYLPE